jgi:hypothetical protein
MSLVKAKLMARPQPRRYMAGSLRFISGPPASGRSGKMGIEFEFRDEHGRRVSEREWLRGIEQETRKAGEDAIKSAIRGARCPVHGGGPRNIREVRRGSEVEFQWDACCERLQQEAERCLR